MTRQLTAAGILRMKPGKERLAGVGGVDGTRGVVSCYNADEP